MNKRAILVAAFLLLLLPGPGFGDIVVTVDGMVFNGKIIEKVKGSHIKIANYHGIFTINHANIKELHETGHYREDLELIKNMGQTVNESDVKTNYQAGLEKIEEQNVRVTTNKKQSIEYLFFVSPFFNCNFGTLGTVMPYSCGAFVLADMRFRTGNPKLSIGPKIDFQYFHSEEGIKSIAAFRFAAGPVLVFPVETKKFSFNITLSPELGTGYYGVTGRNDETADFKLNFFFAAGLEFLISSWVIAPMVRFDYVHDGEAPLYGVGFSLGAGYLFNRAGPSVKEYKKRE